MNFKNHGTSWLLFTGQRTEFKRTQAADHQFQQAGKLVKTRGTIMKPGSKDDNVCVHSCRDRGDPRNILGVMLDVGDTKRKRTGCLRVYLRQYNLVS